MTEDAVWVPPEVDHNEPSIARVYDYLLGGAHNFEVDRDIAAKLVAVQPNVQDIARRNRAFLKRAVQYLVDVGVRQFLDLGSGIPTVGNVHEVAQATAPGTRVLYVDYEEVAVAHSQLLLQDNKDADIIFADVTHPAEVLAAPATRALLDFGQPIAILAVTIGHYISPEADPVGMFATYRDAVVPGSYLALTHGTSDFAAIHDEALTETMKNTRDNVFFRTYDEVMELFTGFDLVDPGMVTTSQWRPESTMTEAVDPEDDGLYAAVGRKR